MVETIARQTAAAPLALPRPEDALSRLHRILVPVDGSAFSEHAITWAVELAHRADATIDLAYVNVLPPSVVLGDLSVAGQWERTAHSHADEYLDSLAARIRGQDDVRLETVIVRDTSAARALVRLARARGTGLAVMATHGRSGAARVWLGSVAEAFIRESPTPVLLLHPDESGEPQDLRRGSLFRRVLVALDGSRNADAALCEGALLAALGGGDLELLHVVDPMPVTAGLPLAEGLQVQTIEMERKHAESYLERLACQVRAVGMVANSAVVVDPTPSRAIIDHAKQTDADLVVVGTRGRKGFGRVLVGSVAEAVVRGTTDPVLVVPSAVNHYGV